MAIPTTPLIAVDIIIQLIDRPERPIVLIERKNPPHGWAIPGGFVDVGETLEQAAVREAKEETCLDVTLKCLLGNYSDPRRDQRHHTVSAVYIAEARGTPAAADDAANLKLFDVHDLPSSLAFDHDTILADYQLYLHSGQPAPVRLP
jgi:8-oxo-dGTP diphosphatase